MTMNSSKKQKKHNKIIDFIDCSMLVHVFQLVKNL